MGAVLREQNALPTIRKLFVLFAAKAAINNCRAGRAAKSANPFRVSHENFFYSAMNEEDKQTRDLNQRYTKKFKC